MGVLKNDVGRPSNKTIMIRNILKGICLVIVLALVAVLAYYLGSNKDNIKKNSNKTNNNKTEKVEKKKVDIEVAKKQLDKYVYHNYFDIVDTNMNDDYKGYLALIKVKPEKKNYTCKEMFGEDIEPYTPEAPDGHSWRVRGLCNDGEAVDFYDYEVVNKEYKKLFNNNLSKEDINPDFQTHYGYSKTKNGFTWLSCECGDISPAEVNKIHEAYEENNELHIVFSIIPYIPSSKTSFGVEAVFDSKKLSDEMLHDIKFDEKSNTITNADELFEKYEDKIPKYDFVLTKDKDSYIYKSFSELK